METIAKLMKEEHERIDSMLIAFSEALKTNSENRLEKFNTFKWNLIKHFLAEETAIFSLHQSIEGEEVSDIFDLMQEHGKIRAMVNSIEKMIKLDKEINISELGELLADHSKFENEVFYPKLDEKLDSSVRERVIERAKEELRE